MYAGKCCASIAILQCSHFIKLVAEVEWRWKEDTGHEEVQTELDSELYLQAVLYIINQ